jgi:hypothetical protein
MKIPRSSMCAVADERYIYAIGGYNGIALQSVEKYDVFENRWSILSSTMKACRSSHISIILKLFQNDYKPSGTMI